MLQGEILTLREWRDSDLKVLAMLRNDIELQSQLMTRARPNSAERVRQWLIERTSREDMIFFVAASRNDDTPLGYLQLVDIDQFHGTAELGICLHPVTHGKGFAKEACELLDSYVIRTMNLRKITLKVRIDNTRAIAFYKKIGYQETGRLKHQYRINNDYIDVLLMERFLKR